MTKNDTQSKINELIDLKYGYMSETNYNNSLSCKKPNNRSYLQLKKKYGITGRNSTVVEKKIDNTIKKLQKQS